MRFRLRTLFFLVAAAAVASWVYFVGWPFWQAYQDQKQLEAALMRLPAGSTPFDLYKVPWDSYTSNLSGSNSIGHTVDLVAYTLPTTVYFVYYVYPKACDEHAPRCPSVSVEVFRVPVAPQNYQPQTDQGRDAVANSHWAEEAQVAYQNDFLCFISSDRKTNPGFKYELIYADPPE
jgi:hypothetical protein